MYKENEILIFYTETPFHPGADSGVGHIDNPIQRNAVTEFPKDQGNGVKGCLREFFEKNCNDANRDDKIKAIFGPDEMATTRGEKGGGAVSFGEAKLLFFPVRSLAGNWAYVTCPSVIAGFKRDLKACGKDIKSLEEIPLVCNLDACYAHKDSSLRMVDSKIMLDEHVFSASELDKAALESMQAALFPTSTEYKYYKDSFPTRVVLLNDECFRFFVKYRTVVEAQNRIDNETGTVDTQTGVWYSEYIPSEAILYSCLFIGFPMVGNGAFAGKKGPDEIGKFLTDNLESRRIWMGGHRTTGKGLQMMHFLGHALSNAGEGGAS